MELDILFVIYHFLNVYRHLSGKLILHPTPIGLIGLQNNGIYMQIIMESIFFLEKPMKNLTNVFKF